MDDAAYGIVSEFVTYVYEDYLTHRQKSALSPITVEVTSAPLNSHHLTLTWCTCALAAQITSTDMFYLDGLETVRELLELSCHASARPLTRNDFLAKKAAAKAAAEAELHSKHEALALVGRMPEMQEVSGYIDFAQRLKSDKWESYLSQ